MTDEADIEAFIHENWDDVDALTKIFDQWLDQRFKYTVERRIFLSRLRKDLSKCRTEKHLMKILVSYGIMNPEEFLEALDNSVKKIVSPAETEHACMQKDCFSS